MNKLMKPKEVKEVLSISLSKVYAMISSGELPCVRLGQKAVRVREEDLNKFIESHLGKNENT